MLVKVRGYKQLQKGSTLIEILVAAFILAVSLTALVSLTTMSIARNRLAKERAVATRLAQEGMDWMIAKRNSDGFGSFSLADGEVYCLNDLSLVGGTCADYIDDIYKRELQVTSAGVDSIEYEVRVYWGDVSSPYEIVLEGAVTRWER